MGIAKKMTKEKSIVEKLVAEERVRNCKMQQMLSNLEYIKWLDSFTMKHAEFSDNDWLYFPENISSNDREQVENLDLMYDGIAMYARKNHIYPIRFDLGNYYRIQFDNVGYEVGLLEGQGSSFFCRKVEVNPEYEFIDFHDIVQGKRYANVDIIEEKLNQLSNAVISLYESGVPLESISITLNKTLDEIHLQNDLDKARVLRRK